MRGALFAILALLAANAAAQTTYKCTDAQGRVTYSSEACDKLGLKDAGKMADRVTTMPLGPAPKPTARAEARGDAPKSPAAKSKHDAEVSHGGGTQVKPVVPLLEKLSK